MAAVGEFALNAEQRLRLLACRAAWEEGEDEERLERLRQREEDAEIVRRFARLLADADMAGGGALAYGDMAHLLALARALAPNPNLDARLLRRAGEPEQMNRDLRDLLFGPSSLTLRLRAFLSRRHAGGQTAMQLLCAHHPDAHPLVTQAGLRALELAPDQRQAALQTARERFHLPAPVQGVESYSNRPVHVGIPDSDPVLRLLADMIVYEAARDALEAVDFLAVHRLLTRGLALRPGGRNRMARLYTRPLDAGGADALASVEAAQANNARASGEAFAPAPSRANAPDGTVSALLREPPAAEYESGSSHARNAKETPEAIAPPVDTAGWTQSDLLNLLEKEIAAQGFVYPVLTVRNYYLCLQSKPFALLSGLSGTGKTRLTWLFARALTGDVDAQYRLLPVRPDWMDSSPLLGYVNLLASAPSGRGTFVSAPFLDFLLRAARPSQAQRAFLLCLDEMNLARVEHYFAEILSAMETPDHALLLPDGRIAHLPANLFLTGTLNLDEATHGLSRKTLDRANTLSFQEVCLREEAQPAREESDDGGANMPYAARQALFLQSRVADVGAARQKLRQVSPPGADFAAVVSNVLADVNALLEPHDLHFAYRVRDEALRYCANSFDVDGRGLLTPDAPHEAARNLQIALDLQLVQKALPRLSGALDQLEAPLKALRRYAEQHTLPLTARRVARAQTRLQRDGFASFDAV